MIQPEERKHLILLRLQQADECISDAEHSIQHLRHRMAANRIYYGMFYAMLALGLLRQFETSKHQQIIGWFNKNFLHTGIFPKHFGRMVKDAFEIRVDSDYKPTRAPTAPDLEAHLADMKLFISTIKAWVEAQPD